MQKHAITEFTTGREFICKPNGRYHNRGTTRYKVKEARFSETYEKEIVIAWRFIKTTQKYSGNAYVYQIDYFDGAEFIEETK